MADAMWTWTRQEGERVILGLSRRLLDQRSVSFIELLPVGTELGGGDALALAQFTNGSEAEIETPVRGRIVAINEAVQCIDNPREVNGDPEGKGWLMVVQPA